MTEKQAILSVSLADYRKKIDELRGSLLSLEKTDEQYAKTVGEINRMQGNLNEVMAVGKKNTDEMAGSFTNLQKEIREGKKALQNMTAGTEEYNKKFKEVAANIDRLADLNANLKQAADDAYKLNVALDVAKVGTSMFGAWTAASALFGVENEKVVQSIQKLQAATTLLNSLKTIQLALFDRGSRLYQIYKKAVTTTTTAEKTQAATTTALATAQKANAAATETATVATNSFKKALIATGIGAFVVLLGVLIAYWDDLARMIKGTTKEEEEWNKYVEESKKKVVELTNEGVAPLLASYKTLTAEWKNLKSEQEKQEWIEKNKSEFNKLGIEINNVNDAEKWMVDKTSDVVRALMLRARAAALNKQVEEDYKKLLDAEEEQREAQLEMSRQLSKEEEKRNKGGVSRAHVPGDINNDNLQSGEAEQAKKRFTDATKRVEELKGKVRETIEEVVDLNAQENKLLEGGIKNQEKKNTVTKKGVDLKEEEIKKLKAQAAVDEKNLTSKRETDKKKAQLEYLQGLITEKQYKEKLIEIDEEYAEGIKGLAETYKDVPELEVKYNQQADEQILDNKIATAQRVKDEVTKKAKEAANEIVDTYRNSLVDIDYKADTETTKAEGDFAEKTAGMDTNSLQYIELENQLQHQLFDIRETARQEEIEATKKKYDDLIAQAAGNAAEQEKLEQQKQNELKGIEAEGIRDRQKLNEADIKKTQAVVKTKKDIYKQFASSVQTLMSSINDIMTENLRRKVDQGEISEEEAEKEFERQKTLQYGMTLLSTIAGAAEAYETAQRLGPPMGPIIGAVNMAAALATGVAQVMQIKNMKYGSEGSASASVQTPSVQDVTVSPLLNERADAQTMTAMNTEALLSQSQNTRVYIMQSDLEASGKQVEVRQKSTTF